MRLWLLEWEAADWEQTRGVVVRASDSIAARAICAASADVYPAESFAAQASCVEIFPEGLPGVILESNVGA